MRSVLSLSERARLPAAARALELATRVVQLTRDWYSGVSENVITQIVTPWKLRWDTHYGELVVYWRLFFFLLGVDTVGKESHIAL